MRSRLALLVVFAFFVAACVIGCSSKQEDMVVAKVGSESITWSEFKAAYLKSPQFRKSSEDTTAKREFLNSLIEKELMIAEAYRQNLDKLEVISADLEKIESSFLLKELYDQEIINKVISESDIREYYNRSADEVKARHILIKAPPNASPEARAKAKARADSLLTSIKKGADFAAVAQQNSEDASNASKGGDLGFFGWGKMVEEFQQAAFSLQPGQVSGVVETQFGYHIIKVDEKRKTQLQDYEAMKPQIRNQLQGKMKDQLQKRADEYVNKLKADNSLTFDETTLALLSDAKKAGKASSDAFTEAQSKTPLATFKGGKMTLGEYVEWESTIPEKARSKAMDVSGIKRQIEGKYMNDFLVAKAKQLGLGKAESITKQMRDRREELMAKELIKNIEQSVQITDADLNAYFTEHSSEFGIPEQVNVQEILVKEKGLADNLMKRLKGGASIATLAEQYSERKWAAKKGGELGFISQSQYGALGQEAFRLGVGQLGGPIKVQEGYSIFRVKERQPARQQSFEEAKPMIQGKLDAERKEKAFNDFLGALKEKAKITVNSNVLAMNVAEQQPKKADQEKG